MELSDKISNILGTQIPFWVIQQLDTRSKQNTQDVRDNDNLIYLANKSAWVRLVSSINLSKQSDFEYFKTIIGNTQLNNDEDLAKKFVLFGGTSKYLNTNSYGLRSGIGQDGAYGTLGNNEIKKYGHRPMPGISSVNIETQGKLGSIRAATINFKCWDKDQLDIIDALYFKLGFSMFLEWGHTFFYKAYSNKVESSELYSIDPFKLNLNKEEIFYQIAENSRNSEGNYGAMLGIVTNFNFSYNQEGGYDCTLKLMSLGVLGDSIKINNPGTLPGLLKQEIINLNNTLIQISNEVNNGISTATETPENLFPGGDVVEKDLLQKLVLDIPLSTRNSKGYPVLFDTLLNNKSGQEVFKTISFKNSNPISIEAKKELKIDAVKKSEKYIIFPSNAGFRISDQNQWKNIDDNKFLELDYYTQSQLKKDFTYTIGKLGVILRTADLGKYTNIILNTKYLKDRYEKYISTKNPQTWQSDVQNRTNKVLGIDNQTQTSPGLQNVPIKTTLPNYLISTEQGITTVQSQTTNAPGAIGQYTDTFSGIAYSIQYENELGSYFFNVTISNTTNKSNKKLTKQSYYNIIDKLFSGDTLENATFISPIFSKPVNGKVAFFIKYEYPVSYDKKDEIIDEFYGTKETTSTKTADTVTVSIVFNDSSVFKNIDANEKYSQLSNYKSYSDNLVNQNQSEVNTEEEQRKEQEALANQIESSLQYQSGLEIILRTIEVHSLSKAIIDNVIDVKESVYPYNLWNEKDIVQGKTFLSQIFSNGIFSPFINKLVNGSIDNSKDNRLEIYAKYGFASSLMANSAKLEDIKSVNYKELLRSYTVPYNISQEITKGVSTNHPVYIPFGLLLMIINNICTIYDTTKDGKSQTPLIYVDFNPETNFCLSNNKQLSTDPWTTLIPFQGTFADYKSLFDPTILDGDFIKPSSGSFESKILFDPQKEDALSGQLPLFKESSRYRGKIMNILLNLDYLINLVKQFATKDSTNKVYLKPFLEQILSDLNKSLGNFNIFRLSYNDNGNTLQVVDDQLVPPEGKEKLIPTTNTENIPLLGKSSIAKSIEIKSEISSKLSNMIAISANPDFKNKSTLSTNGDSVGYINESYYDRYITNRQEISSSKDPNIDTLIASATKFNSAIEEFYSTINPSQTNVSQATNYYIDKMAKIKNDDYATRASAMIPVSVNFNTDGIGGLNMMQGFTIPQELLPYTYATRQVAGMPTDHVNKVGFVIIGLSHILENNTWNTAVKANMIFLKTKDEFAGETAILDNTLRRFTNNGTGDSPYSPVLEKSPPIEAKQRIKIAKTFFEQKGYSSIQVSAIIGALLQESNLNPNAENPSSRAYGIAQWLGDRKTSLLAKPNYQKLETQLAWVYEELTTSNKIAGTNLKNAITLESAIAAMAGYERFAGISGQSPTYQQVIAAKEVGNRIGYTKNIYNTYNNI
jgi:hypothetical protein